MRAYSEKAISIIALVVAGIICIIVLFIVNSWIGTISQDSSQQSILVIEEIPVASTADTDQSAPLTRKTRVKRGTDEIETIFYRGDQEVARETNLAGSIIKQSGNIPDGPVVFSDTRKKTHGEVPYKYGRKHGVSRTYFDDDQIWIEEEYRLGKLQTRKRYDRSGTLRLEADYRNGSEKKNNTETGEGRVYFANGKVRYEWKFTSGTQAGYRKTYDQSGTLVFEEHYNADGEIQRSNSYYDLGES
ncbi:toxin-antitoxin system YwqK family antitoxin [Candidatus Omnitrophota bacterium]